MEPEAGKNIKSLPQLQRVALLIQYDGKNFCGWQRQKDRETVQSVLEEAISQLDSFRPIKVFAAGRTDSGVHASGQVVHFDVLASLPPHRWTKALNGRLPKSIRVLDSVSRPSNWHACYSAIYRRYRYTIFNGCRPNLFLANWSWHKYQYRLDEKLMEISLQSILGFHDFFAFQRAGSKRPNSLTTVQDVKVVRDGDMVTIDIQASGFLYGMVRLLVGQLVAVGEHRISDKEFQRRWKNKLREEIKQSAPAHGLCFIRVGYEENIFPKKISEDGFPAFHLVHVDTPPKSPF